MIQVQGTKIYIKRNKHTPKFLLTKLKSYVPWQSRSPQRAGALGRGRCQMVSPIECQGSLFRQTRRSLRIGLLVVTGKNGPPRRAGVATMTSGVKVSRSNNITRREGGNNRRHHDWLARAVSGRRGLNGQMCVLDEREKQKLRELSRSDKEI